MRMRMIWFKHLILKCLRTVGLMIVHSVHLNTFVLRNLVSFKIPFTDGAVSRDHRSSAQLHLHSGQLSINFDLKLLNSWESFTLLLFNHSTPNIYLFYYSSLERSHLPAKTRKIGHKILWIWATIKHSAQFVQRKLQLKSRCILMIDARIVGQKIISMLLSFRSTLSDSSSSCAATSTLTASTASWRTSSTRPGTIPTPRWSSSTRTSPTSCSMVCSRGRRLGCPTSV